MPGRQLTPPAILRNFETVKVKDLMSSSDRAAAFLRALAHPARLRMVCSLLEGECVAGELAGRARLRAPALSQQAAILEAEGLISRRRSAQSVYYRLSSPHARALARLLFKAFCAPGARPSPRATPRRARAV